MQLTDVLQGYEALSPAERTEFRSNVGVNLPPPTPSGANTIWVMVIAILGIVAIGGGFLAFKLVNDSKNAEAIVAFVSASLGALIGLIAPSPVANNNAP